MTIISIAITALSTVAGAYGLYQVAFAQGYVHGYEDATHGEVTFKEE